VGRMAERTINIVRATSLVALVSLTMAIVSNEMFTNEEGYLLSICCLCYGLILSNHLGKRGPEDFSAILSSTIFFIAYVLQALLFITNSRATTVDLGGAIALRSIFSLAALGASDRDIYSSLCAIAAGFLGLLVNSFALFGMEKWQSCVPTKRNIVIPPQRLFIAWFAVGITVFSGALRKALGLDSPVPSGLPLGIGGLINISSTYIGPNLLFAHVFLSYRFGTLREAKRASLLLIGLGIFNYILFTSKMSLIFPVFGVLVTQLLLRKLAINKKTILLFAAAFLLIYPFLNLYRSATALGVAPGEILSAVSVLYENEKDSKGSDQSGVQIAAAAIVGRLVGYDPLLILLQDGKYNGSIFQYILYGDLDRYLTYDLLDFQDPMGYSPGFIGRIYYVTGSYFAVFFCSFFCAFATAWLCRFFWRHTRTVQFLSPLLLCYSIIIFTDGVRMELIRAVLFSSAAICCIVHLSCFRRIGE